MCSSSLELIISSPLEPTESKENAIHVMTSINFHVKIESAVNLSSRFCFTGRLVAIKLVLSPPVSDSTLADL